MGNKRSLGINIVMTEAWGQTSEVHKRLSILAAELWPIRTEYISVFSNEVTDDEVDDSEVMHDHNTMPKVYLSLREAGFSEFQTEKIVSTLHNEGILFREHR